MKTLFYNVGHLGYLYPYGLRMRPSYSSALLLLLAACGGGGGGGGVAASDNQPNPLPTSNPPSPPPPTQQPTQRQNDEFGTRLIILPDRDGNVPVYNTKVGSYYGNYYNTREAPEPAASSEDDNSYNLLLFDRLNLRNADFLEDIRPQFNPIPAINGAQNGAQDIKPKAKTFHELIHLDAARKLFPNIMGEGYSIVIIDSGIDFDHPIFGDRIIFGYDLSLTDGNETFQDGWSRGHGTVIASIAAGQYLPLLDNKFKGGIAPEVNIIAIQILNNTNNTSNEEIEEALQWVIQNTEAFNIVAVNFSISNPRADKADKNTPTVFSDEFRILARLGVSTVVAAGNNFSMTTFYDGNKNSNKGVLGTSNFASDPFTIAVGALNKNNQLADFTERDTHVIFAPGEDIYAANRKGGFYDDFDGSSYAAPIITGAVVLAQQLAESKIGRRLTFKEINNLLVEGSEKIPNYSQQYNRFLLDKFLIAVDEYTDITLDADDFPDKIDEVKSTISFNDDKNNEKLTLMGEISPPKVTDDKANSADQDWFKVNLPAGMYQLIMSVKEEADNILDSFLEVYLPKYGITFKNDDHHLSAPPGNITPLDAVLTFILNEEQDIYIGASATPYAVKDQKKKEGDYKLELTQQESINSSPTPLTLNVKKDALMLLPLEVDVFTFDVVVNKYYTLTYDFTLDTSVKPVNPTDAGALPVNQYLKGHYNNLTARIYSEDGGTDMQKLPIHTFPTPNLPKELDDTKKQFTPQDEKPTIFQAEITGKYSLILSDPLGRQWNYEITLAEVNPPIITALPDPSTDPNPSDDINSISVGSPIFTGDNNGVDKLYKGTDGRDKFTAGFGNDELHGGKGADIIDGGEGVDTASYIGSDQGVTVDLSDLTVATDDHPTLTNAQTGGHAEGDTLINIENLVGSKHNDILTGDDGRNILHGDAGDDILDGGAGDDILDGGAGDDILDGGAGNDRLTGGSGGDKYILKQTNEGTDTVIDFNIIDGDKIQIDTADGTDSDLAGIGVYIQDSNNDGHAEIVNASDASQIYMILENIDFEEITDTNFSTYFEVI